MKTFDLTSGTGKLELAMQALKAADLRAEPYWNDEAHRRFQETYLVPLEPKVRGLIEAVQHLAEVLAAAERQCGENY
jgi:uncharacterized protein YukE